VASVQRHAIFARSLEKALAERSGDPLSLPSYSNSWEDRAMTIAFNLRGKTA
jgi:hypothetical protein